MKLCLFFLVFCVTVLVIKGNELTEEHIENEWQKFKVEHNRAYPDVQTEERKREIFRQNLIGIHEHNKKYDAGIVSWSKGVNQFTDLTQQEFAKMYLGRPGGPPGRK